MLTFSKLGKKGRLGNQLFQIASIMGIAAKNNTEAGFPHWKYEKAFVKGLRKYHEEAPVYQEPSFNYCDIETDDADLDGYFQSERYFEAIKEAINEQFTFTPEMIMKSREGFENAFKRDVIAVHIRRGDYKNNPNYVTLPILYHCLALLQFDYKNSSVIVFSDDIEYCKVHLQCLPHVYFAGKSDIEDLCLMTQCDHFIIANSTFSWWGAWLGEKPHSRIIRPAHHFNGKLKENCDIKDLYPERWEVFDHEGKKFDFTDVTFTVPVHYDHKDRKRNIGLSLHMILKDFDTHVIVGEQGSDEFVYHKEWATYIKFPYEYFHRTRMLNKMAHLAKTDIVVNHDCDVILPPMQMWMAVEAIRDGADIAYAYDGRFARVPRNWFLLIKKEFDIGCVRDEPFKGTRKGDKIGSVGGQVFANRKRYLEAGGENECYISWGSEDAERYYRFNAIGYSIVRINGILYHLDHYISKNSSYLHAFGNSNKKESAKIYSMPIDELIKYVKSYQCDEKTDGLVLYPKGE